MSREETQNMMVRMMDMFFGNMTSEGKKEFMKQIMPKMIEKIMEGMSAEDKQELMGSMLQRMMSTIIDRRQRKDFKPSEFCPCCNLCEEDFKKKHGVK